MNPRYSNNTLKPGEASVTRRQANFMLATDWGVVEVLVLKDKAKWKFNVTGHPDDWGVLWEWLSSIEDVLYKKYNMECPGLAKSCVRDLKRSISSA